MRVLFISTYDQGRQPFGLASPAAWLQQMGTEVICRDLSQTKLTADDVQSADLIAFFLPMHTATRLAVPLISRLRAANPRAYLCAYGLYAPVNADMLHALGVNTVLGGEFEEGLVLLVEQLSTDSVERQAGKSGISLNKQKFRVPDRSGLPDLSTYAHLIVPGSGQRVVGYTETSRGCRHLCRHCPIVPVYNGAFRVVQRDIIMEDIRQQLAAGAEHITFGDPDFFNGIKHGISIVEMLHEEAPHVTYDVTIKVSHLLKYSAHLPLLKETGCAFVTSAVESIDDRVLALLDKGHTQSDFVQVVKLFEEIGLVLAPTFVAFHPWSSLESYEELLDFLAQLGIVEHVPPVQLAIRLLIPAGSRLLELREIQELIGDFDQAALSYRWSHPDERVDKLQREIEQIVQTMSQAKRADTFLAIWKHLQLKKEDGARFPPVVLPARVTVPYLTEPWFCCAEPTTVQLAGSIAEEDMFFAPSAACCDSTSTPSQVQRQN